MRFIISFIIFGLVCFGLGYKLGDTRGYNAGFDEGYSYDCRAELGKIASYVYSVKKNIGILNDSLHAVRENLRSAVVTQKQAELESYFKAGKDTTIEYVDEHGRRHLDATPVILGGRNNPEFMKRVQELKARKNDAAR